jgi:O-methyltransferase
MFKDFKAHLSNWHSNPRRAKPGFIFSRLWKYFLKELRPIIRIFRRPRPLEPPIQTGSIEILLSPAFRSSVAQVKRHTCLDEARLANVWNSVKLVGSGIFLEVGSFRGGTALHICNAIDDSQQAGARFYSFDPFEKGGFESPRRDEIAFTTKHGFTNTDYATVAKLLSAKPNAMVVQGFFPQAAEPFDLQNIAFCHLDVDLYEATRECLNYMAPRLAPRSAILLDDLGDLGLPGVRDAVNHFLAQNPSFLLIEIFPLQGLLLPRHLW